MKLRLHIAAGALALLLISTFWLSSVAAELFLGTAAIVTAKTGILYGMALMIPAMVTVGATGASLGQSSKLHIVAQKFKRMKIIAANGVLVLIPSAVFLAMRAQAGQFDGAFYTVQVLELLAGATNFTLLALNFHDGRKLGQRRRSRV